MTVLRDVRVIDFGRFIAAPYCGMLLADMGAEVIRVERPRGDEDRRVGLRASNGENFIYPNLARNKKAVTLDPQKPRGRDLLQRLVGASDVFLHNFAPDTTKAMELRYDDVRKIKASVIYAGISCYGPGGPDGHRTGFDPMAQVVSGAAAVTGFDDQVPLRSGVPWVDYSTGLCAAFGVMLALRHRDRGGGGQEVECSLLQTAVSYMAPMIAEASVAGIERPRLGNKAAYVSASDLYKCRDGSVYIAAVTEAMWRALVTVIGHAELADDPGLRTDAQRFQRRGEIDALLAAWASERSVNEVQTALDRAHVPCGVYHSTREVSGDAQVLARRMLEYMDLDAPGLNHVPVGGLPVRLSHTPGQLVSRAPRVGEHNLEVYGGLLGCSPDEIDSLRAEGAI